VAELASDLPLFAAMAKPAKGGMQEARTSGPSAVEAALIGVNPDELSPREALEALYRLKALLADRKT
jgi:DNA mismatch repair protein MutS